jgi:hypothetical protein
MEPIAIATYSYTRTHKDLLYIDGWLVDKNSGVDRVLICFLLCRFLRMFDRDRKKLPLKSLLRISVSSLSSASRCVCPFLLFASKIQSRFAIHHTHCTAMLCHVEIINRITLTPSRREFLEATDCSPQVISLSSSSSSSPSKRGQTKVP